MKRIYRTALAFLLSRDPIDYVKGMVFDRMTKSMIRLINNNKGAVLVLVLFVLITMIIISVTLMQATTTETKVAGNERVYQEEFYICEAAGEITKARFDTIVSSMIMKQNTTVDISASVNGIGPVQDAKVEITYTKSNIPPVSSGTSPATAFANYYTIRTTVNGKIIERGVWKAFPKSQ